MEASALSVSHSSAITRIAKLNAHTSKKHWKWQFAFKKSLSRRCLAVKNVASKEKQTKVEEPPELDQLEGVSFDALKPDSSSITSSIKYHAEFTPS